MSQLLNVLFLKKIIASGCLGVTLCLLAPTLGAQESSFRIRAREHFDSVWVTYGQQESTRFYRGIGPNINIWMEKPYHYSFGLSYSVLFINNEKEVQVVGIKSDMELTKIGFEFKNYFNPNKGGLFARLGISSNKLNTKGSYQTLSGAGGYLGLGWEFKFSQLGLALEMAGRKIQLEQEISIDTFSPSIGVHFYGYI